MKAGLGLVRRNNFFYTEKGSWLFLESWLIDRELELKKTVRAKPYPEKGDKCRRACPTRALPDPYVFNLTACISYLTRRGGWDLTAARLGPWSMALWLRYLSGGLPVQPTPLAWRRGFSGGELTGRHWIAGRYCPDEL